MCRNCPRCSRRRLRCIATNVYCRQTFKGRIHCNRFMPAKNQARCSCK